MKQIITTLILLVINFSIAVSQLTPIKPLLDAQKNNSVINIPQGKYLMDIQNGGGYTFTNLTNVTINLNGSEIICNKGGNAFTFSNCTNVTINGFSLDFDPLLFTQGVITAVDAGKMWLEFVVDEGYPTTEITNKKIQFYDPITRELKRNSTSIYEGAFNVSIVNEASRKFRITKNYYWDVTEKLGDLLVLHSGAAGHAFYMYKCKDMRVEDVTLYGAGTFAYFENETENSLYLKCKLTTKKNEPERPSARLRSGNADGIHSKNAYKGPTIENCEIMYGGDDCIAINGAMYPVYSVDAATRTISFLASNTSTYLVSGDTAQFVSYAGKKLDVAKVEIVRASTPTSNDISNFLTKYPSLQDKEDYTKGFQIRVNKVPEGLVAGDVLYSRDRIGSGFVIKNNKVGHIRSRAILIKASDGIITGNTVSDCEMGGIVISPEYNWMEAGFSSNLEISNNTITNCMFGRSSATGKPGAISIMCLGGNRAIAPVGGFSNIRVFNNTITQCPRPLVVITSVDGLRYYNNTVEPDLNTVRTHGQNYNVPNNVDYWTRNVSMITSIEQTNSFEHENIRINGANITGLTDYIGGTIKLYSVGGSLKLNKLIQSDEISIDALQADSGLYIVSVTNSQSTINKKILIN
ncbi:MAG: T9SS type A sorting domain-containing protein [Paludibacter sp.]|jgi:hypothetical protein|nr:T9SS type A sorting domain-containing protein [Paludibacter sp.]